MTIHDCLLLYYAILYFISASSKTYNNGLLEGFKLFQNLKGKKLKVQRLSNIHENEEKF